MFGKKKNRRDYNFYEEEVSRLQEKLKTVEPGSEEYKEIWAEINTAIRAKESHQESNRRMSKENRGQLWIKGLGIGGILTGIGLTSYFELKGNTYSGEKRKWVDEGIGLFHRLLGK